MSRYFFSVGLLYLLMAGCKKRYLAVREMDSMYDASKTFKLKTCNHE